jgi:hypothetical protein
VVEYPLLFGADATRHEYYDVIADIVATFAGALVAGAGLLAWPRVRRIRA